jgi:hypothetical protein
MLSFNGIRPIARINGGPLDKKIIFLRTENDKCCEKHKEKCKTKPCCDFCPVIDEPIGTSLHIKAGNIEYIPNPDERNISYICGPSGVGKSTQTSKYVNMLLKMMPNLDVYVFSRKSHDPAFDSIDKTPKYVPIDERLITKPIDIIKQFKDGAILIFDDIGSVQETKIKEALMKLIIDAMEVGRANDVYLLITNHLVIPDEKKFARTVLNEAHDITVYPKSGSSQQIRYALGKYAEMSKDQLDNLMTLPSRSVTIYKRYPKFVIYDKGIYLPD